MVKIEVVVDEPVNRDIKKDKLCNQIHSLSSFISLLTGFITFFASSLARERSQTLRPVQMYTSFPLLST